MLEISFFCCDCLFLVLLLLCIVWQACLPAVSALAWYTRCSLSVMVVPVEVTGAASGCGGDWAHMVDHSDHVVLRVITWRCLGVFHKQLE